MAFWKRNVDNPPAPPEPPVPPPIPELDELARLIPERDGDKDHYWQPYVDRIIQRFDGLPAPDGGEFVRACLSAGCKAVPVVRLNTLWQKGLSGRDWDERYKSNLALRVRLGLFFAASLRYLVHALCRLRIKAVKGHWHPLSQNFLRTGDVHWRPLLGGGVSFRELQAAFDGTVEITWLDVQPTHAEASTVASCFLHPYEMSILGLEFAVDVMGCAEPGSPGGLFSYMLFREGQIEAERLDVASLCLQALRDLVRSRRLRLNTNPGDLFVTPELSFLAAPAAVDVLLEVLRRRGHSLTRPEVYQALGDAGCLVGVGPGATRHTCLARLKSPAWRTTIRVRGLAIADSALWDVQMPPGYLDGTLTIQG